jgi:hypothetical protein
VVGSEGYFEEVEKILEEEDIDDGGESVDDDRYE